jgi:hypothetical protein
LSLSSGSLSGLCTARVTSPSLDLNNAVVNITSSTFRNIDTGVCVCVIWMVTMVICVCFNRTLVVDC